MHLLVLQPSQQETASQQREECNSASFGGHLVIQHAQAVPTRATWQAGVHSKYTHRSAVCKIHKAAEAGLAHRQLWWAAPVLLTCAAQWLQARTSPEVSCCSPGVKGFAHSAQQQRGHCQGSAEGVYNPTQAPWYCPEQDVQLASSPCQQTPLLRAGTAEGRQQSCIKRGKERGGLAPGGMLRSKQAQPDKQQDHDAEHRCTGADKRSVRL